MRLPAVASQTRVQCLMTAFVSTYRCGAVPESHRVPSCPEAVGSRLRTSKRHHMRVAVAYPAPHVGSACRVPRIASMRRTIPLVGGAALVLVALVGCSGP